jgi:hypothetical protein
LRLPAWKQIVSPSYEPGRSIFLTNLTFYKDEPLPQEYELLSFKRSSDWLRYNSGLFVSSETFDNPNISCPAPFAPNLDVIYNLCKF